MSCNYADGLSPYHDKGQLGLEEKFDTKSVVTAKVSLLTKWINEAKHVVIHTGAGISTSAGIPDFRGPRGVWTLQAKGEKPDLSKDFNEATPTPTHMAIMKLVEKQKVKYVVSQNIDGLHLRSNLQRKYLSELHGNMFTEQCNSCNRQFVRSSPVPTVGQKSLNKICPGTKSNGRPCRGRLHDTILDWEHNLPENDLGMADYHSCLADLSISLGTTMQIVPSGNLPLYTKRHGGKLVIVNLQPTKHDSKANLLIHAYVDEVMGMLMKNLNLKIPKYSAKNDPTRTLALTGEKFFEWTISNHDLKKMKKVYEEKCGSKEARKRLEMIYDDVPAATGGRGTKRKIKEPDHDSDLEIVDVIVKPKKGRGEGTTSTSSSSRRGSKKNAAAAAATVSPPTYNTTITIKKVTTPAPKKVKYEGEKITIKKNVTPTRTKYEIVTKPKKVPKCEIVYCTDDNNVCSDLEMVCESDDDDEAANNFTYNYKMYLSDTKTEPKVEEDPGSVLGLDPVPVPVPAAAPEVKPEPSAVVKAELPPDRQPGTDTNKDGCHVAKVEGSGEVLSRVEIKDVKVIIEEENRDSLADIVKSECEQAVEDVEMREAEAGGEVGRTDGPRQSSSLDLQEVVECGMEVEGESSTEGVAKSSLGPQAAKKDEGSDQTGSKNVASEEQAGDKDAACEDQIRTNDAACQEQAGSKDVACNDESGNTNRAQEPQTGSNIPLCEVQAGSQSEVEAGNKNLASQPQAGSKSSEVQTGNEGSPFEVQPESKDSASQLEDGSKTPVSEVQSRSKTPPSEVQTGNKGPTSEVQAGSKESVCEEQGGTMDAVREEEESGSKNAECAEQPKESLNTMETASTVPVPESKEVAREAEDVVKPDDEESLERTAKTPVHGESAGTGAADPTGQNLTGEMRTDDVSATPSLPETAGDAPGQEQQTKGSDPSGDPQAGIPETRIDTPEPNSNLEDNRNGSIETRTGDSEMAPSVQHHSQVDFHNNECNSTRTTTTTNAGDYNLYNNL